MFPGSPEAVAPLHPDSERVGDIYSALVAETVSLANDISRQGARDLNSIHIFVSVTALAVVTFGVRLQTNPGADLIDLSCLFGDVLCQPETMQDFHCSGLQAICAAIFDS